MNDFKKLVRDINKSLDQILFFETVIVTIVVFLASFFFLAIFDFYPWIAIFPALIYFLVYIVKIIFSYKPKLIESKYEEMRERLSTAVDTMDQDNEIVRDLQQEIIRDARHVELSSFLESRTLSWSMLSSLLLSIGILLLGVYNVQLVDVTTVINRDNFNSLLDNVIPGDIEGDPANLAAEGVNEDIYGDPNIALLGEDEVDVLIHQSKYELFGEDIEDAPEEEFESLFPGQTCLDLPEGCGSADVFENDVPVEDQELVKNYFLNIVQN